MPVITITDVLDGILERLAGAYPDAVLYAEEIKQGFAPPCFYVKLAPVQQERQLHRRNRRSHTIVIQYYSLPAVDEQPLRINRELHGIAEKLYGIMRTIPLPGSSAPGTGMSHEVNDETLHFFVTYAFDVIEEAEPGIKMAEITQEVRIE